MCCVLICLEDVEDIEADLAVMIGYMLVRALAFRFEAFGRPVKLSMVKKFEEGVFSDLRNLKPGEDSSLEKPKVSRYLELAGYK